ncbi:MAG TPA: DUF5916 domain-containing protein [Parafilimonas sp.]|nr:DUF5916 domain-containing protein [Parafilimonas sp.]
MKGAAALFLMFFLISFKSISQSTAPRILPAKRATGKIKIDGILNEAAWKDASVMADLIEFRPKVGVIEDSLDRTVSYLIYDDEGIYFGGFCYERTKDSIATELVGRDGFGTNDYVGIIFDTYDDKLNGFEYFVTPLNEQWDAKMNPPAPNTDNEDFTWNSVWQSGAVITDSGWSFEMFIPFSAIRFSKKDVQDWGFNITRRRRKTEQQYTWNPIDPNVNGFLTQEGIWKGLSNIKPPLRLQFSPYLSFYENHYLYNTPGVKNWTDQVNGGMDLKYGINQAFTLDATLIPDFGQVQSDNQVLNLTPFEVKYNEYRPFFTEGTELFGKGNLFYSRRIGGTPIHMNDVYNDTAANEEVIKNPTESKLINATKISGRTKSGLGIGFLNAITTAQYATLENTSTKEQRKVLTDPITNYNIIVLDQTLKHNSSVSFVNTDVWRSGSDYDANVSAGLFELNDKTNTYNLGGEFAVSNRMNYLPGGKTQTGYSHELHLNKTSGNFNFTFQQQRTDDKFSSDDMGYFTNNNFLNHYVYLGYHWIKPKDWWNRINLNFNNTLSYLSKKIQPINQTYQYDKINVNANVQSKKLWYLGAFVGYSFKQNDFYEPRTTGWFFKRGASINLEAWFQSNDSKKYTYTIDWLTNTSVHFYHYFSMNLLATQAYRFNNKFSLMQSVQFTPAYNDVGYTYVDGTADINFAKRHVNTTEHIVSAKYNFTNKMGITCRVRHYVSTVENKEFFLLQHDGTLLANPDFHPDANQNVNYFNVDMVYTWEFAPGSFFNLVWKNAVQDFSDRVVNSYFKNLNNTLGDNSNNNFSIKIIYFLDYLKLKNSLQGKS